MKQEPKEKINFDWIILEKEKKLKEMDNVKANIRFRAGEMFGSNRTKIRGVEGFMKSISMGLVILDGIKMGMRIIKRFKSSFITKKNKF